ncbi:MAG TPA: hypothetical protein VNA20_17450 [Frankiaceae bacterium]|nr:hypothetical protein [Frankiaceae bacterium]
MRRMAVALAAALAVAAAPAGAEAPERTDRGDLKARRAAEWLREKARLGAKLPSAVGNDAQVTLRDTAGLVDAGDLDGDGRSDVVDVGARRDYDANLGYREGMRLNAYRGVDGKALWTRDIPAATFVFAVVTKVGTEGKPGVVVVSYDETGEWVGEVHVGGRSVAVTVRSYDRTGALLWERPLHSAWGAAPFVSADVSIDVEGTIDAVAGGGTDLLLRSTFIGYVYFAGKATMVQFSVMDGATGAVEPLGQPLQTENPAGAALAAGDLDGDRLDDVVTEVSTSASLSLVALSSADGRQLWKLPGLAGRGDELWLTRLPDVTGDGRADVGALMYGFGPATVTPPEPSPTVAVVDGARGTVPFAKTAWWLMPLGDADGRPGAEVAVAVLTEGRAKAGFAVSAYTAAGRRLWTAARSLPVAGRDVTDFALGQIGDTGGDGVAEIGYGIVGGRGRAARRDEGIVDGRTGRVRKDPRPGMHATRAALDGRGSDTYQTSVGGGTFTVHTWRGDRPSRLWSAAVRADGVAGAALPVSVDGDRCTDVAFTLYDRRGTARSVVFSGSTGRPLWQLDRAGAAAGTVSVPRVVGHRTYQRGC